MALLGVPEHESALILNTPNRNELLKEGPPQDLKCNLLGRGAYGTVLKAVFQGKQVAVKVVKNAKDIRMQSMRNEAHILGWRHRNIVRILKIESTGNFGIVIMERFAGQTLQEILDVVDLPLVHRIFVSLDILSALSYCHRHGLVHLDVKPQNVLVAFGNSRTAVAQRHYVCKLCDFGSSLRTGEQDAVRPPKGSARGTVRYMSPEALRGEALSPAADIYSLGVAMWQMKRRRIPYHWLECNEIVAYQVVKHKLRPDDVDWTLHSQQHVVNRCDCVRLADARTYFPTRSPSIEQLRQVLEKHKAHVIDGDGGPLKVQPQHQPLKNKLAKQDAMPARRRPFQELNTNGQSNIPQSVVRNLRFDHGLVAPPVKELARTVNTADHANLHALFHCMLPGQSARKEATYQQIYESCWQSEPQSRPAAAQLVNRLGQLL